MAGKIIKLSIVICTYNRGESLRRCLRSLIKANYALINANIKAEVIIIDGGSKDETNDFIKEYSKKLRIKKVVYLGKELARVRDRGWREAKGEIVAWIDDDVVVSPGWAENLLTTFIENPDVGGVSGPTIVPPGLLGNRDVFSFYHVQGWKKYLGRFWNRFFLEGGQYKVGRIFKSGAWSPGSNLPACLKLKGLREVDYLEACNMALRRELVQKVGGFDYGFTKVAEWSELDLAIRVKKLGHKLVFNPKVRVDHHISQGGVYPRRTAAKQRMENFYRFYFRHIFKLKPDYIFKFTVYVIFLDLYWLSKALATRNLRWLGGWAGTMTGFMKLK